MIKVWLAATVLLVSVSCAGEKNSPRRSSPGQTTTGTPEGEEQQTTTSGSDATQQTQEQKEEKKYTSTCDFKDSKFMKIFDLLYAATKLGVLKDDDQPEIRGVIEILKHIKDNMGTLGSEANLKSFAQETSSIASQNFDGLSDEEKLAIDAGVLAAMKAIDLKCSESSGDFTFTQLFGFMNDIIKALPSGVNAKIGDYDLESILIIAQSLGDLLESEL